MKTETLALRAAIDGLRRAIEERDARIEQLRAMYASTEQSSGNWHKEAERLRTELVSSNAQLEIRAKQAAEMESELAAAQERVRELERHGISANKFAEIMAGKNNQIAKRDARIAELERQANVLMSEHRRTHACFLWRDIKKGPNVDQQLVTRAETAERERDAALQGERDAVAALDANWVQHQRIVKAETDLAEARDCGQPVVCKITPGCQRHWEERNRELVAELAEARAVIERARTAWAGISEDYTQSREFDDLRALLAPPTTEGE
jgi:hypothetical protein